MNGTMYQNKEFMVVLDVAKKRDYMTTQIYRDTPEIVHYPKESGRPEQIVNYLDLVYMSKNQGITYVNQGRMLCELMRRTDLMNNSQLLIDGTGVGDAVVDIIREMGLNPLPIVFTGGSEVHVIYEDASKIFSMSGSKLRGAQVVKEIHVPKEDLVHAGMILMQQGRMRIAPGLSHVEDFKNQLMGFRGKVNEKTGHTKYENLTDEIHDDLVVDYLIASWWMTYKRVTVKERVVNKQESASWDPFDYLDK